MRHGSKHFGLVAGFCWLFGSLASATPLVLPVPSGNPQAIDFDRDPLIAFAHNPVAARPFLEALGRAVETHPAVDAAIAGQQSVEGVRTQLRSGLFPSLDAQLVTTRSLARRFRTNETFVESLAPHTRTDAVLDGEQLIWDFGATGNRIAAADDRIDAARAEVEQVAGDTAMRAVTAWYDLLGTQARLDLNDADVARQRSILGDVQTRLAQGVGGGGDVARAEAVLADTRANGARLARLLAAARGRYREAFGTDAPLQVARPLPPVSTALSLDAAQAMSRRSPEVRAALKRAAAARRDDRAARADGLPRLSAGLAASRYDVFTGSDYDVRGSIMLRQSLFGGGQRGRRDEAAARARQAGFVADQIVAESERDAGVAFTDVVSLAATAASLEAAYIANRRARDSYVEQFRVSRGSLIELLRAEQDYAAAAGSYLQGVIELDVARFALLARTGEILPVVGIRLTSGSATQ